MDGHRPSRAQKRRGLTPLEKGTAWLSEGSRKRRLGPVEKAPDGAEGGSWARRHLTPCGAAARVRQFVRAEDVPPAERQTDGVDAFADHPVEVLLTDPAVDVRLHALPEGGVAAARQLAQGRARRDRREILLGDEPAYAHKRAPRVKTRHGGRGGEG